MVFEILNYDILSVIYFEDIFFKINKVFWLGRKQSLPSNSSQEFSLRWMTLENLFQLFFGNCHECAHGESSDAARPLFCQEDADLAKIAAFALNRYDCLVVSCQDLYDAILNEEHLGSDLVDFNDQILLQADLRSEAARHFENERRVSQLKELDLLNQLLIKE